MFPQDAWLVGDVQNAFNSVRREAALRAVEAVSPELAIAMSAMYRRPTRYVYSGDPASPATVLESSTGVVQGDPLSMLLYCVAQQAPLRWAKEAFTAAVEGRPLGTLEAPEPPAAVRAGLDTWVNLVRERTQENSFTHRNVNCKFFADDGVWRLPPELLPHAPALVGLCWGTIGLRIKPGSWRAWASFALPDVPGVAVVPPDDGLVVAGCPISVTRAMPGRDVVVGGEDFVRRHVGAVHARASSACEALLLLPRLAAAAYPAEKYALRLLRLCIIPRFGFVGRVCCPAVVEPIAKEFDDTVWRCASSLAGWSAEESAKARSQGCLRHATEGGLGLLPVARRAPFGYLASWLDCSQALADCHDIFSAVSDNSILGRRLRDTFAECVRRNPTNLPESLADFVALRFDERAIAKRHRRSDGSVRWQAVLARGLEDGAQQRWIATASKQDRERCREMGGDWLYGEDVNGCTLTRARFHINLCLRFGLPIRPALPDRAQAQQRCSNVNQGGIRCDAVLDDFGHHACNCSASGGLSARHDHTLRVLARAIRQCGVRVSQERWIDDLTTENADGTMKEARMDIEVRDGAELWWVDGTFFHPYHGGGGRSRATRRPDRAGERKDDWSLESRARQKHRLYPTRDALGRRVAPDGIFVPLVGNSLCAIGKEGLNWLAMLEKKATLRGRTIPRLVPLVQGLIAYFEAELVLRAYGRADQSRSE